MKEEKNFIEEIINCFTLSSIVEIQSIPNIDLYMDQITTFIENSLYEYKRNKEDKILTKTMINNYAKAKIFPPPQKKKYTKNHVMLLIIIYHLKSILSISDISKLLRPITEELTKNENSPLLEMIYKDFVQLQQKNSSIVLEENYTSTITQIYEHYENEMIKNIMIVLQLVIKANTEKRIAEKILDTHFQKKTLQK